MTVRTPHELAADMIHAAANSPQTHTWTNAAAGRLALSWRELFEALERAEAALAGDCDSGAAREQARKALAAARESRSARAGRDDA